VTRHQLAAGWVGVQLLFFAGWTVREQVRAASGPSILVKVVPVDPRDLLRGQYLRLAYEFSRPWDSTGARLQLPGDAPVWVVLDSDEVALRGRARGGRYVFGVEQYFVPEGTPTPAVSDLTVRLRVGPSGTARIEQVYVRGAAWP